jgi:CrcB protein
LEKYMVVAIGGALGAIARYWLGSLIGQALPSRFPYGTVVINVTGCFIIGLFLTLASERISINPNWRLAVAVGFVGAYTTFSTFEYESFKLMESGSGISGFMNVIVSLMLGFLAVWAGVALARKIDSPSITRNVSSIVRMGDPASSLPMSGDPLNESGSGAQGALPDIKDQ